LRSQSLVFEIEGEVGRGRNSKQARGREIVYDAAGGLAGLAFALQRRRRMSVRGAARKPKPGELGRDDWVFRQYAGDA